MVRLLLTFALIFGGIQNQPPKEPRPVLVIDPGHGGKDRGGFNHRGFSYKEGMIPEDAYTYDVALRVSKLALEKNWVPINTVISPGIVEQVSDENTILSPLKDMVFNLEPKNMIADQGKKALQTRLKVAKKTQSDNPKSKIIFISIHFDYEPGKVSGAKMYTEPGTKSMALARILSQKFKEKDIGFMVDSDFKTPIDKANKFIVLKEGKIIPRVLIELGNFNNDRDRVLMLNSGSRQDYAQIIIDAVEDFLNLPEIPIKKSLHK